MSRHIILLGDSVFDNAAYVGSGDAVIDHLRRALPDETSVSLLAVDGTTTGDFSPQVDKVPADATHLILSLGGNDAIMNSDLLGTSVESTAEALHLFGQRAQFFEAAYATAVDRVLERGLPTCVSTIYNGNLSVAEAFIAKTALCFFNDALIRVASQRGLCIMDLRFVCGTPEDYANPIEPSALGGQKIAQCIARWIHEPIGSEAAGCRLLS